MDEEDFEKVRTESTRVINLMQFTDVSAIDPMYVDKAYYLAPDGPMAADAFAVMRDGMQGKAGIGKVALYGREYLVAVRPHKQGLVMYTLHHAAEIRTIDQIDELREVRGKVKPGRDEAGQAGDRELRRRISISPTTTTSTRRACAPSSTPRWRARRWSRRAEAAPPKVVDLMEALRKSLERSAAARRRRPRWPRRGAAPRRNGRRREQAGPQDPPESRLGQLAARASARARQRPRNSPSSPIPLAVGSRSQSGGVSHTKARIAITQTS